MIARWPLFRSRSNSRRLPRKERRRLLFEGLEARRYLAGDASAGISPWQNAENPFDANNDQMESSIDYLVVINAINRLGAGDATDSNNSTSGTYPDINGDQQVSALDALMLANALQSAESTEVDEWALLWLDEIPQPATGNNLTTGSEPDLGDAIPDGTNPGSSDPGSSDPGSSDPGSSDPGSSDPGSSDPGGSDPGGSDPGGSDPGGSDPGGSDPGGSDPGGSDPGGSDPGGSDPGGSDPGGSDPGGSDPGGSDPGGSDPGGSDPGDGPVVCGTSPVTISAPAVVSEFSIFQVAGNAKYADSIRITGTGLWSLVDGVGATDGFKFNRTTGAFSQLFLFRDDHPAGTAKDPETITVEATGPCAGTASTVVMVQNVDVTASATLDHTKIKEGESVGLTVTFSDAVLDGQTIVVDWGDGSTDTKQYPDQEPNPPFLNAALTFLEPPQPFKVNESFAHRYRDDNPTATPSDKYVIKVTVTDNDTSSAVATASLTVDNVPPAVTIDGIVPLDDKIANVKVEESEGFIVRGHVTDSGVLDGYSGTVRADLNWDGDFDDPGEKLPISGGVGQSRFEVTFSNVPDDGPSASGNKTASDSLKVLVDVFDDDTGFATASGTVTVHNDVPKVYWSLVQMTYTRDFDGNIDTVTVTGDFQDLGEHDKHELGIRWGDGVYGDGFSRVIPITGRSFHVTRSLPREFGPSILRIFPILMGVRDDDLGTDSGKLEGTTHWSFDPADAVNELKDLVPRYVQPFSSNVFKGAKWKGYGEALIGAVSKGDTTVSGSADSASAVAYGDFTGDPHFRVSSHLDFSVACDAHTGDIALNVSGGGGGNVIMLDKDGKFLGWNYAAHSLPREGQLGSSTNAQIDVTPAPGIKTISIDVEAHFGLDENMTFTTEIGPQIDGPGGRITKKSGTSSTYPAGLEDFAHGKRTYTCAERLKLSRIDVAD